MRYVVVAVPFSDRWYFDAVVDGAASNARKHDAEVRIVIQPPAPGAHRAVTEEFVEAFADPDCVGAVSVLFDLDAADTQLLSDGKPVVVVGGHSGGLPSVFIDDTEAAYLATQHLVALGHTSIAHLAGYATAPDDFAMRGDRVRGYSEAMHAAGLDDLSRVVPSGFAYDDAHRAATQLLAGNDRPTAIFAVADEVAFAVLDAAHALGFDVPRDLSVIGVDDHQDADHRGLTTVRQDPRSLGAAALARLFNETRENTQRSTIELVIRSSTSPPSNGRAPAPTGILNRLISRRARRQS